MTWVSFRPSPLLLNSNTTGTPEPTATGHRMEEQCARESESMDPWASLRSPQSAPNFFSCQHRAALYLSTTTNRDQPRKRALLVTFPSTVRLTLLFRTLEEACSGVPQSSLIPWSTPTNYGHCTTYPNASNVTAVLTGPSAAASTAEHYTWSNCPATARMQHYKVMNGNHEVAESIGGEEIIKIAMDFHSGIETACSSPGFGEGNGKDQTGRHCVINHGGTVHRRRQGCL